MQTTVQSTGCRTSNTLCNTHRVRTAQPKSRFEHVLDDLAVDLENPKAHWNYGNEDFLGQICKIARRTLYICSLHRLIL
jgi:hypothetical protein